MTRRCSKRSKRSAPTGRLAWTRRAARTTGRSGETLGESVGVDDASLRRAEDRAVLARLMRRITPREREVLFLRFIADLTQAEIGARLGLSQMQVSRIIRQALSRLRTTADARGAQTIAA
jgi:RNA polymerase sigma-B factor